MPKPDNKKTNGERLFKDDPELLLDTACGFDCNRCACQPYCPPGTVWYSDECKIFKFEWMSDWYEWPYKKSDNYRKVSEKDKILASMKKNKTNRGCPKSVRCVETGDVYNNATEAGSKLGIDSSSISKCCRGTAKTCGGYHWEYA